jgi:hypothetical protein
VPARGQRRMTARAQGGCRLTVRRGPGAAIQVKDDCGSDLLQHAHLVVQIDVTKDVAEALVKGGQQIAVVLEGAADLDVGVVW